MSPPDTPADATDLELIPRLVRDKLDRVGVKLHLREWQQLELAERAYLRDLPCDSATEIATYTVELGRLVSAACGHPPQRLQPR